MQAIPARSPLAALSIVALLAGSSTAQQQWARSSKYEFDDYQVQVNGWNHVLTIDLDQTSVTHGGATPGTSEELIVIDAASEPPIRNGNSIGPYTALLLSQ